MASLGSITRVTVPHPWLLAPFEGPRATAEALSLLPSAPWLLATSAVAGHPGLAVPGLSGGNAGTVVPRRVCLLYTSDAAGERSSVDLGGRRIIKKKNNTS